MWALVSHSPEETDLAGEALGRLAQAGDVFLLQGELGTGKTRLTQALARGLGVEAPVTSPTFVIVNEYRGRLPLYHIDLYRLERLPEVLDLGLDDYFFGDGVCAVEWPDRAPAAMPPEHLLVELEHAGDEERALTFKPAGARYDALLSALREELAQLYAADRPSGSRQ